MTNELDELESDINYFNTCIKLMPKGKSIADYMIDIGICERAIQALEKQIPKKWQYEMVNDDDTYVCPCCKEYWYMDYGNPATNKYNYCPNCGQRLDWKGEQK